ncbi:MAG: nickel-dependent lactate racemase, partial [Actinobacteria bacterium]|nr:nickel-dependent lactate racemase [Actinomycetota bacterium]
MNFEIPYGKHLISLSIPGSNIINFKCRDNKKSDFKEEQDLIISALENPVSSQNLAGLAYGKKDVCILVSDITRPCPSYKFLPYLVKELKDADVRSIKIVFGLGIHRSHTQEEQIKLVGAKTAEECKLMDFDKNKCSSIGSTSYGTPVEVSEEVINSDFIIATGNIEYHYFAGYSGGAKAIMPGACSYNSVCANHSMMLDESARAGEFVANPVRQDIEEAGRMAQIDFIFNVILDDSKKIIGAVAGKNNEALLQGINIYDWLYEVRCAEKANIVIASAGGYPKDINLYQAQKALENVKDIVKDGGIIILAAECTEGFGEDKFAEWMQETKDFEGLFKKIRQKFVLGGHKAVAVSKLLTRARVILYSNFDSGATNNMGFEKIDDI